ncbi:RNA polymerase I subunit A43 [Giardia lamblia P15]|uniref:RNA polymerase I subunit A43 n=1 Tax=Giardia intestinalis (strain P15) TaxID=658858 RepID=E1F5D0_GIAIA|nr:RNA polymerase I subunit A43 [Giardia lamblia P15]
MSFITEQSVILRLAVLPHGLSDMIKASKAHLNQYLFNLLPTTQSLLLGYKDIELIGETAALTYHSSHIHFTARCTLLLFRPEPESLIHATIKHTWPHFIYLLFRGSLPVYVPDPGVKYIYRQGVYCDKDTGEQLTTDMVLQVRVKSFGVRKGSYAITCSMDDPEYRIISKPEPVATEAETSIYDAVDSVSTVCQDPGGPYYDADEYEAIDDKTKEIDADFYQEPINDHV